MHLSNDDKNTICRAVIEYLIGETLDTLTKMYHSIAYKQKELVVHPTDICRFIYQNREYRSPRDTIQQFVKAYPLHKTLHKEMPAYLALLEPFELESARIRSVTLAAVQVSGSYNDLVQLLPKECLTNISFTAEEYARAGTLSQEEIDKFKEKHQAYLDAIKVNLFSRFLAGV